MELGKLFKFVLAVSLKNFCGSNVAKRDNTCNLQVIFIQPGKELRFGILWVKVAQDSTKAAFSTIIKLGIAPRSTLGIGPMTSMKLVLPVRLLVRKLFSTFLAEIILST